MAVTPAFDNFQELIKTSLHDSKKKKLCLRGFSYFSILNCPWERNVVTTLVSYHWFRDSRVKLKPSHMFCLQQHLNKNNYNSRSKLASLYLRSARKDVSWCTLEAKCFVLFLQCFCISFMMLKRCNNNDRTSKPLPSKNNR